jgi:hypothetical protein
MTRDGVRSGKEGQEEQPQSSTVSGRRTVGDGVLLREGGSSQ